MRYCSLLSTSSNKRPPPREKRKPMVFSICIDRDRHTCLSPFLSIQYVLQRCKKQKSFTGGPKAASYTRTHRSSGAFCGHDVFLQKLLLAAAHTAPQRRGLAAYSWLQWGPGDAVPPEDPHVLRIRATAGMCVRAYGHPHPIGAHRGGLPAALVVRRLAADVATRLGIAPRDHLCGASL